MKNKIIAAVMAVIMAASLTACTKSGAVTTGINDEASAKVYSDSTALETVNKEYKADTKEITDKNTESSKEEAVSNEEGTVKVVSADDIDTKNMFSEKDTDQSPDLSDATSMSVKDGENITIDAAGIYVLSGQAENASVIIDASKEDKVQLVLDSLTITNKDTPCIYVNNADKVFITLKDDTSSLSVTGEFTTDSDTKTDAVIFSKDDLTINGTGSLSIASSDNGVACKDTLKVTGGSLDISCKGSALESKDEILISGGTLNITGSNDGLHAEDNDDDTKGYIYISGGSINISAEDDAIHATTVIRIDGGEFNLKCAEGIEGTVLQINDGDINIEASDDGINAAHKSSALSPVVEINGGKVTIKMAEGDTDGIDSNGDITVNGGTIDITGRSTFDYDGKAVFNGGTIIENGTETNTITNQMMGGHNKMDLPEGMTPPGGMSPPNGMTPPERGGRQKDGSRPEKMVPPEGQERMVPPLEDEELLEQ